MEKKTTNNMSPIFHFFKVRFFRIQPCERLHNTLLDMTLLKDLITLLGVAFLEDFITFHYNSTWLKDLNMIQWLERNNIFLSRKYNPLLQIQLLVLLKSWSIDWPSLSYRSLIFLATLQEITLHLFLTRLSLLLKFRIWMHQ